MRTSLLITLCILLLGGAAGFFQEKRNIKLQADAQVLLERANRIQPAESASTDARSNRILRPGREVPSTDIPALATGFIDLFHGSGDVPPHQSLDLTHQLIALDPAEMRGLIGEILSREGIPEKSRANLVGIAVMMHANDHPAAAASLLLDHAEVLEGGAMTGMVAGATLRRWAGLDVEAALRWIESHAETHPELAGDEAKRGLLSGVAANDSALAFSLLGGLGLEGSPGAVSAIVEYGGDEPGARAAVLTALRDHAGSLSDPDLRTQVLDEGFGAFAHAAREGEFEPLSGWLDSAVLSNDELQRFTRGLSVFHTEGDTGRWIDWMAGNLPPEAIDGQVGTLVSDWTQHDYLAAGNWLRGSYSGPAGAAAVAAYAATVAEYEPEVAVQWADTLPPGPKRQATLAAIRRNWPADDPDGARQFAIEHGIE